MKVLVACREDQSFEYAGVIDGLQQETKWPYLSIDFPHGDNWLGRLNYLGKNAPIHVRKLEAVMFVLYETLADAAEFAEWLRSRREEQVYNYSHLRG